MIPRILQDQKEEEIEETVTARMVKIREDNTLEMEDLVGAGPDLGNAEEDVTLDLLVTDKIEIGMIEDVVEILGLDHLEVAMIMILMTMEIENATILQIKKEEEGVIMAEGTREGMTAVVEKIVMTQDRALLTAVKEVEEINTEMTPKKESQDTTVILLEKIRTRVLRRNVNLIKKNIRTELMKFNKITLNC